MIYNSMTKVHQVIEAVDNALKDAVSDTVGHAADIADAFSSFSDSEAMKISLDIFSTVFGLVSVPIWNSCEFVLRPYQHQS